MSFLFLAGAWLATYAIHSTLLAAAAWLAAYVAGPRRSDIRELAWKLALVGGIFTSSVQWALPGFGFGGAWLLPGIHQAAANAPPAAPHALASAAVPAAGDAAIAPPAAAVAAWRWTYSAADVAAWCCGLAVVAFAGGLLVGLQRAVGHARRLAALQRRSQPLHAGPIVESARRLAKRLGLRQRVALYHAAELRGPLAAGVWRPRIILPAAESLARLEPEMREALLAHELAHLQRRDPLWALIAHFVCHAFWLQPLNLLARRQLRTESEYLADALASRTQGDGLSLARCLAAVAEWLQDRKCPAWIGAVGLGAFDSLLGRRVERLLAGGEIPSRPAWMNYSALALALLALLLAAPRVESQPQPPPGEKPMNRSLALLAVTAGLAAPAIADEPQPAAAQNASETKVPEAFHGFSGTLVGLVVSKDVEAQKLVLKVQQVKNVWKNSKAQEPGTIVGRTVSVEKFFGKWIDVLLVVKPGDTVELETKHVRGDQLQFLGENFKKVPAISAPADKQDESKPAADKSADNAFPAGLRGFRGILEGKVVRTDTEKGQLVFQATEVKRTWPKNTATNAASCQGRELTVNGIAGKWLDVLLVLKPGDKIEVEAFHNRGESLDFVQEWLKKVE